MSRSLAESLLSSGGDDGRSEEEGEELFLPQRPRRNRRTANVRRLVREHRVDAADLIQPLFIMEGEGQRQPIASMPGIERLSLDTLIEEVRTLEALGIPAIALFPKIDDGLKDPMASESLNPQGLVPRAIRMVKDAAPDMTIITDVAMDPYSSDGHDGIVHEGKILNDPTLEVLAGMALTQAEAGADIIAPSDMMDGRVGALRTALDAEGHSDVGILSYAVKYASAFYGPFRDALDSAPKAGDKKTYQMDPGNLREAIREVVLDEEEGADMVMVKPGLAYLDVVRAVRESVELPIAAYHVSGEYAMLMAAAEKGWIDGDAVLAETLLAFKRAGADMILTYAAKRYLQATAST